MKLPQGNLTPADCRARVEKNHFVANHVRELVAKVAGPKGWKFEPGQFTEFSLPGKEGKPEMRFYSLASEPSALPEIRFAVKILKDGVGSAFFESLKPGDEIQFNAPYGVFTPCSENSLPAIFVAAGTGISPLRSILRETLLKQGSKRPITLYFGVRNEEGVFYFDEFADLAKRFPNFRFLPTLSQPGSAWKGLQGRVTEHVRKEIPSAKGLDAYLCGSPAMVNELSQILLERGLDPTHLHRERY